jgi:hypothetical protein
MLDTPYQLRPIRFLGIWDFDAWRMKAYGISYANNVPDPGLINAARHIARQRLSQSENSIEHYGVGFIGIHEGKTDNFVFISWWSNENELYHHVYTSPTKQPENLVYMTPSGLTACTWDLRLMCFERDAWVEDVLKKYPEPDIIAYLDNTLNIET